MKLEDLERYDCDWDGITTTCSGAYLLYDDVEPIIKEYENQILILAAELEEALVKIEVIGRGF